MNTFIKTIIILVTLVLSVASASAQNSTLHFGYDANGNRISRTLSVAKANDENILGDTINAPELVTDITDLFGNAKVSIYPNPTHEKLTVSLSGLVEESAIVRILTTTGIVIIMDDAKEGNRDFDLSRLTTGMYLLQLSTPSTTKTWKIIKN